jgi:hypothetical protein
VQKSAEELVVTGLPPEQHFGIATASLGYSRDLAHFKHTALALGARGELAAVPVELRPAYGTRHPAGFAVYLRLHPMLAEHGQGMQMPMEAP